ncbi:MAG: nucleotidyltransferase family protein [Eubacteriales bacterium]|nr:nucleotidyltransferase family protein [Eubacteriales bacterium]
MKGSAMTVTALIAEFNPFHNGHAYYMEKARSITGADFLAVVMSGNYVQRGEPAIMDKFLRAEMALACGADLVLELPVYFSTASAEAFARQAVCLINELGCADYLCFGTECDDISVLSEFATVLAKEPPEYKEALQAGLKSGLTYPQARQSALLQVLDPAGNVAAYADLLSAPNNILGIEYLKALRQTNSPVRPVSICRVGSGYHDSKLCGSFSSATALRRALTSPGANTMAYAAVPAAVRCIYQEQYGHTYPVQAGDFSMLLHSRLLEAGSWEDLAAYASVSDDLARRIFRRRYDFTDFHSFAALIKPKNLTESHVRRALLHILLGLSRDLPEEDAATAGSGVISPSAGSAAISSAAGSAAAPGMADSAAVSGAADPAADFSLSRHRYIRILGLRRSAAPLLHRIKKEGRLPLISKLADAPSVLSHYEGFTDAKRENALFLLSQEIRCSELYGAAAAAKFGVPVSSEYARRLVILP